MELVLSAYARPDLLGQAVARGEAELGEARQQWGWSLIQTFTEVRRWLATLGRSFWLPHWPSRDSGVRHGRDPSYSPQHNLRSPNH